MNLSTFYGHFLYEYIKTFDYKDEKTKIFIGYLK